MHAQLRRADRLVRSVSFSLALGTLLSACSTQATTVPTTGAPTPLEVHAHEQLFTVLARPSAEIAALTGGGSHYRLIFEAPGEVALVLLDADEHARMRLWVRSLEREDAVAGWAVDFEHVAEGVRGRVELWTVADLIHGQALVGQRDASWRVQVGSDGRMAAQRWMGANAARSTNPDGELEALRSARALGVDLSSLAEQLDVAMAPAQRCRTNEAIEAAKLGLDLALRALEGRGRSGLPIWAPEGWLGC